MNTILRQTLRDSAFLLVSFPLAVASFVVMVTGLSLGAGTLIIWVGIPILVFTLVVARGFATVGRRGSTGLLGLSLPEPRYKVHQQQSSPLFRALSPLTCTQSWFDVVWCIVIFPVATATFVLATVWWSVALFGLTYPFWSWMVDFSDPDIAMGPASALGISGGHWLAEPLNFALGLLFAVTLPFVVRGCAHAQAQLGRVLLTTYGELQGRISDLSKSRAAATSAEASALRRLERDLHDGPQQRLVRLGMELSKAQRQLATDPEAAHATISEAIVETRDTLGELRNLSRGIAPPILTDRGLPGALASLTARSIVPVDLAVETERRYPPAVENAVYFVAAECLTNIAKHSGATRAAVALSQHGGSVLISVSDNGFGGAHIAKGHGLAGLVDRVRAVEGELVVDSPPGGPTVIVAEVPCEL
ncbi:sensor histidine kinase [Hoyosella subflava]|uniref:histidine kinase n=1 Tax=Hoyosella subflava (strain DSM 45089 / JCM 17490 / NBRC 109087 / DQS3-9A1) TaxID=443218 RepID=F6EJS3_HOYSD|nr:sensor histidine kinase [Hoyosella subflava]AEF40098.1 Signal transduction histidine kinase-like protein [Hoyosella subflava DQS3-9A1]